jgi:hypothetical protein
VLINYDVQNPLNIPDPQTDPLDVVPDIQDQGRQNVENDRKTYCKERRVDKKQPDLAGSDIKSFCQVSTNAKTLLLEISDDLLVHFTFLRF